MTDLQTLTPGLRAVVAAAEFNGYTLRPDHDQFFTLVGPPGCRDFSIWLNARGGVAHFYRLTSEGQMAAPIRGLRKLDRWINDEIKEAAR